MHRRSHRPITPISAPCAPSRKRRRTALKTETHAAKNGGVSIFNGRRAERKTETSPFLTGDASIFKAVIYAVFFREFIYFINPKPEAGKATLPKPIPTDSFIKNIQMYGKI